MIRNICSFLKRRFPVCAPFLTLALFIGLVHPPAAEGQVYYNGQKAVVVDGSSIYGATLWPFGVGVDGQGNLYVADSFSKGIWKYAPSGPFATATSYTTGPYGTRPIYYCGSPFSCFGIYVDGPGNVFYSDYGGSYTMLNGEVVANSSWPTAVTVDPQGQNIFAANQIDATIIQVPQPWGVLVKDDEGRYVDNETTIISTYYSPTGIAADGGDTVYYAAGNNVYEASPWSGYNPVVIASNIPNNGGLIVDSTGTLYVTNSSNGQLLRLSLVNGNWVQSVVAGGFNRPGGVAEDSAGNLYVSDSNNYQVDKILRTAGNLGTVNVGSSSTISLPFSVIAGTTIGSISIVTGGVSGLDYQDAGSSTCTAKAYTSTTNCSVNLKFAPTVPGTRAGELTIADASGNILYRMPLQGMGAGPLAVVESGVQTMVTSSSLQYPVFGSTVSDQAGNLYAAFSSQNEILEIAPGGTSSVLSLGSATTDPQQPAISATLSAPSAVAIDNAGSLYIADTGNNRVVVRQPVPGSATGQYFLYKLGLGTLTLNAPNGLATDASGNVYIMDNGNSRVIKVLPSGAASVLPNVNIGNLPVTGFMADGAGNLYLTGNGDVVRFPAGSSTATILYTGYPSAAALDAAGDLYIADYDNRAGLVEIPVGGTAQTVTLGNPAGSEAPSAISIDSAGNFYLTYSYGVYKVGRTAAALSFVTTALNHTSSDSPQTVQLENAGNQPLTVTSIGYPTDFPVNSSDTSLCTNGQSLAPGAACDVSVQFVPQTAATLSESVSVSTNAPNGNPTIGVTGTGSAGGQSQTVTLVNRSQVHAPICCGPYPSSSGFYVSSSSSLPVTVRVISGPMNFSGSLSKIVNTTAGSLSLVLPNASGAGSGVVEVDQPGTSLYAPATPVQLSYTVNPESISIRQFTPTPSGTHRVYGSSNSTLTYILQGVQLGDQLHLAVVSKGVSSSSPVGSYKATVALVGQAAANYTLTNPTLPFTVTPAPLTLVAADAYQLVGATPGPIHLSIQRPAEWRCSKRGDGRAHFRRQTATATSGAGTYAITPGVGTLSAANYSFPNLIPGELNIFAPINLGYAGAGSTGFGTFSFPTGSLIPAAATEMLTGGNTTGAFGAQLFQCTAGSPGSCSASLTFSPPTPGSWTGALQLFDASTPANLLVSIPVYGTGIGSQVAFRGGASSNYATGFQSPGSMAFDGLGNLYVADQAGAVYKIPAGGGTPVTIGSGWSMPTSVVTDGAGNVYVCDYQLNGVYKITPGGVQTKLPLSLFTNPAQLGMDAMGNLYINVGGSTVYEVHSRAGCRPPSTRAARRTTIPTLIRLRSIPPASSSSRTGRTVKFIPRPPGVCTTPLDGYPRCDRNCFRRRGQHLRVKQQVRGGGTVRTYSHRYGEHAALRTGCGLSPGRRRRSERQRLPGELRIRGTVRRHRQARPRGSTEPGVLHFEPVVHEPRQHRKSAAPLPHSDLGKQSEHRAQLYLQQQRGLSLPSCHIDVGHCGHACSGRLLRSLGQLCAAPDGEYVQAC